MSRIENRGGKGRESVKTFLQTLLSRVPDQGVIPLTAWIQQKSRDQETPYSEGWYSLLRVDTGEDGPNLSNLLRGLLKDKLIVDLGCGEGRMREVLNSVGVAWQDKYIGVDLYHAPEDKPEGYLLNGDFSYQERDRGIFVKGDMLNFLNHVPDGAIPVVILNGIDASIIQDLAYHYVLAQQITRVLPIGGVVITRESQATKTLLRSGCFETLYSRGIGAFILRKTC